MIPLKFNQIWLVVHQKSADQMMFDHGVLNSHGQAYIRSGVKSTETPPNPSTGLPTLFQAKQDDMRLSIFHLQRREGPIGLENDLNGRVPDCDRTADGLLVGGLVSLALACSGNRPGFLQDEMV